MKMGGQKNAFVTGKDPLGPCNSYPNPSNCGSFLVRAASMDMAEAAGPEKHARRFSSRIARIHPRK